MNCTGGRLEGGLEGGLAHEGRGSTTDEYYAQQYSQYYRFLRYSILLLSIRTLGTLRAPTSRWRPFGRSGHVTQAPGI